MSRAATLLICCVATLAGCQNRVTEINGRKVIGSRWVNGQIVYLLADDKADAQAMKKASDDAKNASKGIVFKPLK